MLTPIEINTSAVGISVAKTDKEDFDLTEILYESLVRVARVFREGSIKYGKDNWKKGIGDKEYQLERANHALKHLLVYIHELKTGEYLGELKYKNSSYEDGALLGEKEDDLSKVMWFCMTQIELERLEKVRKVFSTEVR